MPDQNRSVLEFLRRRPRRTFWPKCQQRLRTIGIGSMSPCRGLNIRRDQIVQTAVIQRPKRSSQREHCSRKNEEYCYKAFWPTRATTNSARFIGPYHPIRIIGLHAKAKTKNNCRRYCRRRCALENNRGLRGDPSYYRLQPPLRISGSNYFAKTTSCTNRSPFGGPSLSNGRAPRYSSSCQRRGPCPWCLPSCCARLRLRPRPSL